MVKRPGHLGAVLVFVAGIITALAAFQTQRPAAAGQPAKRTIYMAAIEAKGSTTVHKEPFPSAALPPGPGYILESPDKGGKWVVETYRWLPSTVVVNQGDEVTLEILGVNGEQHPSVIEGYGIGFMVRRGQVTRVHFKADKAGIFNIACNVHRPTMTAQLVVLPRPR
ncbi:MAG: hypothetical protein ACE5JQ_01535 [Candidatus Methylomirabilales bacterium]